MKSSNPPIGLSLLLLCASLAFPDGLTQKAVRVEKGPTLDGSLGDEAWKRSAPFDGFKMVFPNPGDDPTERTELRILFDRDYLYVGVYCVDREAGDSLAGEIPRAIERLLRAHPPAKVWRRLGSNKVRNKKEET